MGALCFCCSHHQLPGVTWEMIQQQRSQHGAASLHCHCRPPDVPGTSWGTQLGPHCWKGSSRERRAHILLPSHFAR